VSGFDIIYSLMDDSFDREHNLFSIPAAAGVPSAIKISVIIHIVTFLLVILAGILGSGGVLFWIGSFIFISLLAYQHLIVRHDDLSRVNLAFGTTNGIASLLFAVFVICDLIFI